MAARHLDFANFRLVRLGGGRSNAYCGSTAASRTRIELTHRVRDWFAEFSAPPIVVFDYEKDFGLLAVAMRGGPPSLKRPGRFCKQLHLDSAAFKHPAFEEAADAVYTAAMPWHHALADARALMAGYLAWRGLQ